MDRRVRSGLPDNRVHRDPKAPREMMETVLVLKEIREIPGRRGTTDQQDQRVPWDPKEFRVLREKRGHLGHKDLKVHEVMPGHRGTPEKGATRAQTDHPEKPATQEMMGRKVQMVLLDRLDPPVHVVIGK